MSAATVPRIAAYIGTAPGFFVIELMFDDGDDSSEIYRQPVIGWAIDEDAYCNYPITPACVHWSTTPYILQPDGTVERPNIDGYANLEDWKNAIQREHANPKRKVL